MLQDVWLSKVNEIIQGIPLEENEQQEQLRDQEIVKLRKFIAQRWKDVYHLKTRLPDAEWNLVKDEFTSCIKGLIELHGDEIPFAPDLPDIALPSHLSIEKQPVHDCEVLGSEKASSTTSSRLSLEHSFYWVEMPHGVWTVLQARKLDVSWVRVVPNPTG